MSVFRDVFGGEVVLLACRRRAGGLLSDINQPTPVKSARTEAGSSAVSFAQNQLHPLVDPQLEHR